MKKTPLKVGNFSIIAVFYENYPDGPICSKKIVLDSFIFLYVVLGVYNFAHPMAPAQVGPGSGQSGSRQPELFFLELEE